MGYITGFQIVGTFLVDAYWESASLSKLVKPEVPCRMHARHGFAYSQIFTVVLAEFFLIAVEADSGSRIFFINQAKAPSRIKLAITFDCSKLIQLPNSREVGSASAEAMER